MKIVFSPEKAIATVAYKHRNKFLVKTQILGILVLKMYDAREDKL